MATKPTEVDSMNQLRVQAEDRAALYRRALLLACDGDDDKVAYFVSEAGADQDCRPAVDAGERESEGARCCSYECKASQQDGVLCADDDCDIASGVRSAALPAADPERREGAEGVPVPIPHTFAPPDADTGDRTEGGKNG